MEERAWATGEAVSLMEGFAERTGLVSGGPQRRYLWTDAFAVCNLLALARTTGALRHGDLALRLVDQVHHVLGRHRADDPRRGWISGLDEGAGALHPTRGGLRIGKSRPERPPGAPFDERLEWERDGQYFHYLTRWMHALDQVSRRTGAARFNTWARELAEAAHRGFTSGAPGRGRHLAWKMSIDLSRPQVPSMGHHDPLDGFIMCLQLRATAAAVAGAPPEPTLDAALDDFAAMTAGRDWATGDALGIGGLLMDACRVAQLVGSGAWAGGVLLDTLLAAVLEGVAHVARQGELQGPASHRLPFRELGLAIGLAGVDRIVHEVQAAPGHFPEAAGLQRHLEALESYRTLGAAIESFWLEPSHRTGSTWTEHRDINEVMLATRLLPDGVLDLGRAGRPDGPPRSD